MTGERIVFDETVSDDERLVWNEVKPAHIEPPPVHYHPDTEEHFEVNEGQLLVEIEGKNAESKPARKSVFRQQHHT